MSETTIDLRPYEAPIRQLLEDAVSEFAERNSDTEVSLLVVDYSGLNPMLMIALDSPSHSAAHVKKFAGEKWAYGEDSHGTFCNSPWDCEHQLTEYHFDGFPDLYDVEPQISLITQDGSTSSLHLEEDGDEAVNEVMFRFLLPIVEAQQGYRALRRADIFRVGVHVQDSSYGKFWRAVD